MEKILETDGLKFKNLDDAFINSAYLSELWAVNDLLRFKKEYPETWSPLRERQLQDEVRHASSLLDALKKHSDVVEVNLNYSMQSRLYRKYLNLGAAKTPEQYAVVHEMTEYRAMWIYKTYLKCSVNSPYKNLLNQIIKDEKNHFDIDNLRHNESAFSRQSINAIDKLIFRAYLPEKYGRQIFKNYNFWKWYYQE